MITCPSCNHQNPEGSLQCENCYTPLPSTIGCPNCGASVQTDATFCGQCGFNLQAENPSIAVPLEETAIGSLPDVSIEEISLPEEISLSSESSLPPEMPSTETNADILPEISMSSPIQSPWDEEDDLSEDDMTIGQVPHITDSLPELETTEVMGADLLETDLASDSASDSASDLDLDLAATLDDETEVSLTAEGGEPAIEEIEEEPETNEVDLEFQPKIEIPEELEIPEEPVAESTALEDENISVQIFEPKPDFAAAVMSGATQLQVQTANLLHLQTNTTIEIPSDLNVVHIGKPNGQIPPDIDVAGLPDSEVVSRVHADIRIEGDAYYVEDVGSSNGTYVNHSPLVRGNRHKLRSGDRIALGKGDLVTFIFQLS